MRFLAVVLFIAVALAAVNGACQRRVCYFANWAQYGATENTRLFANEIDPFLCTHIIYAFAKITDKKLASVEWNDESANGVAGQYEKATNLKQANPNLKILLAVGGWSLGSDPFHEVVDTPASRNQFVTSSIQFLRAHRLDGLDIDWEFPANRGSPPEDKHKFSLLVGQLREAFNNEASGNNRLLLTAAVNSVKSIVDTAYEVASLAQNLDWINLMTYDFHGSWDAVTGQNSPLYAGDHDTGVAATLNIQWAANYWVQQGAPKDKLVIGLGLYGKSFTLTSENSGVGAPATVGAAGPYSGEGGTLAYYEICQLIKNGASVTFLNDQRVPYLVSGNQWVGYDNEASLREKVRFIKDNGYGGTMVWALQLDDVKGGFCGKGHFPLANAIKSECS
jgi:chitinase